MTELEQLRGEVVALRDTKSAGTKGVIERDAPIRRAIADAYNGE